jgi:hypothetical protein
MCEDGPLSVGDFRVVDFGSGPDEAGRRVTFSNSEWELTASLILLRIDKLVISVGWVDGEGSSSRS